ncbi:MAG: hypothetical protein ACE5EY_11025 [Anaerolineae bacterium]
MTRDNLLKAGGGAGSIEGNKYKFRAECQPDIDAVLARIPSENVLNWKVVPLEIGLPDRVCVIELRGFMLDDLKEIMEAITDGHVMAETVEEIDYYTEERSAARPTPPGDRFTAR